MRRSAPCSARHVVQKGSLVAPDRLRFDFAHPKPMDAAELEAVEDLANQVVLEDAPVETRLMDRDEAMQSGAMALFGEKYGDEVRVVSMGTVPEGGPGRTYSVELCGGTHVGRTGEVGLFTIVGESAVAAGVRRIEALTGTAARKYLAEQEKRLKAVAAALKVRPDEAAERVAVLVEERRRLERDLAEAKKKPRHGRRRQRRRYRRSRRGLGQVPRPGGLRHCTQGPQGPGRRRASRRSARASWRSSASPRTAGRGSSSASPTI